jgi:hypothetical protein
MKATTLTEAEINGLRNAVDELSTKLMHREMELAELQRQLERAIAERDQARTALLDTAADVRDLTDHIADTALPTLRPGLYADDPMPDDGTDLGAWPVIDGDRYETPTLVGTAVEE